MKKILLTACVFSVCLSGIILPVSAAKKPALNTKKVTLTVGKSKKLTVKNTKKKVSWTSSNKKVAAVSSKGTIKARKAGKAVIKAKVGGKTLRCTVVVKKGSSKPSGIPVVKDTEEGWGPIVP